MNKNINQYLSVGSSLRDGSQWNDVFVVGLYSSLNRKEDFSTKDSFKTINGIMLGMSLDQILKAMVIPPTIKTAKDSIQMLRYYYYYDFKDYYYEFYRLPKFMIAFRFVDNKLTKFGFGNYLGFFDKDFSLDGFEFFDESKEFRNKKYF